MKQEWIFSWQHVMSWRIWLAHLSVAEIKIYIKKKRESQGNPTKNGWISFSACWGKTS